MLKLCGKICKRLANLPSYMDNMGNAVLSFKKDSGREEIFIKDKKSDSMTTLSVPVAK